MKERYMNSIKSAIYNDFMDGYAKELFDFLEGILLENKQQRKIISNIQNHIEIQKSKKYNTLSTRSTVCNKLDEILLIINQKEGK